MFGGGGMNPRKMKQMMKQMGIDVTELDAEEVVIRTDEADLVFRDAQVTRMDAQGQQTYQIVGDPDREERGAGGTEADDAGGAEGDAEGGSDDAGGGDDGPGPDIPDSDVRIVAERAGASPEEAREALVAENGNLAAAISRLQ